MAWSVKVTDVKPDGQSSIPRPHMMLDGNKFLQIVVWLFKEQLDTYTYTYAYTYTNEYILKYKIDLSIALSYEMTNILVWFNETNIGFKC